MSAAAKAKEKLSEVPFVQKQLRLRGTARTDERKSDVTMLSKQKWSKVMN